ncbi:MAG TPA: homocysteine S-methyltransferase family protein [Gammaproteobacteria bacterium]
MGKYSDQLPQLQGKVLLSDGGLETTLIFHDGYELPYFAAFELLRDEQGYHHLKHYFHDYLKLARKYHSGFLLESCTWRASSDWGKRLGHSEAELTELNRKAIDMLLELREEFESADTPIVISGCIGPRGDGYRPEQRISATEAARYHLAQIETLRDAGADLISGYTIPTIAEALGITRAAQQAAIPVVISYTLETDGSLPSGESLQQAIEKLDEADTLDAGDPQELAAHYRELQGGFKQLTVLGGCCGTDHRHVAAIGQACLG